MKVICPECASEYDVPPSLVGEAGRRVRCSTCGHVWMAIQQEEQGGFGHFDESQDIEPIPMSVHPQDEVEAEGHDGPGFFAQVREGTDFGYAGRLLGGFGLACLFFAIFLGIGVAAGLNEGVLRPLFAPFGLAGAPQKIELEIKDVKAVSKQDAAGQPVLTITGIIHNPTAHTEKVPVVEVSTLSESGAVGDSQQVEPSVASLESKQDMTFTATMAGGISARDRVRVRFIP